MTVEISHEKLNSDEPVVLNNLADGADTREFLFRCDLSNTENINTEAYGDWLTVKYFLSETMNDITREYADKDVSLAPATIGEHNAARYNDIKAYFVAQDGEWLKLVVQDYSENVDVYLTSPAMINLSESAGVVTLRLSGTAYIGSEAGYTDTIRLEINGVEAGRITSPDGAFEFDVDVTDKEGELGLRLFYSKSDGETDVELKQGQGTLANAPMKGNVTAEGCEIIAIGSKVYSIYVDEWNNVKLRVKDAYLSDLAFDESIYIEVSGNDVTLVIKGNAYIAPDAVTRTIKLSLEADGQDYKYENVYDNNGTEFEFRVDLTEYAAGGDWYKLSIQIDEGDAPVTMDFNGGIYSSNWDWEGTYGVFQTGNIQGVKYAINFNGGFHIRAENA